MIRFRVLVLLKLKVGSVGLVRVIFENIFKYNFEFGQNKAVICTDTSSKSRCANCAVYNELRLISRIFRNNFAYFCDPNQNMENC